MNVGYMNSNIQNPVDEICPLCGDNIYVNKYGTDYLCVNKDCKLNKKASVLVKEIELILQHYLNRD